MNDADSASRELIAHPDAERWRALIAAALGGEAFERLVSETPEGLTIEPLYGRALRPGARALRQTPGPWRIAQRMDHPDPDAANAAARVELQNGAGALTLAIAEAPGARGFGVAIASARDVAAALRGIDLDLVCLRLDAGPRAAEIAGLIAAEAHDRRLTAAALDVDFGYDPIGGFARAGTLPATPAEIAREGARLSQSLRDGGFAGRLFLADGRPYHDAGAGEAQELALVLATGLDYLRLLESAGAPLTEARKDIAFLLAADADEFLTLAKFRALRRLWAAIESACGLDPEPVRLHAETAFRMVTRRAPFTNVLRTAMGVFAAGVGGADVVTALPFTLALGLPDAFARRIARNAQLLMIEEAGLAKVADPAAGSGALEALTEQLCERAWALFQRLESSAGVIASLEAGWPQQEIAASAAIRRERFARRKDPITGVSDYPDLAEAPVNVLAPALRDAGPPPQGSLRCAPLPPRRDAEPFELLRDRSDAELARCGARPAVFLANLGEPAEFLPSANFASSFFAAGGFEASDGRGFATAQEAAEAFHRSGRRIACICASPARPVEQALDAARGIRAAGAARICLVGPACAAETLREAGIKAVIGEGCDAIAILEDLLAQACSDAAAADPMDQPQA